MKIGIDSFTIRELKLEPYAMIDYVKNHGFDGVQFDSLDDLSPSLDEGVLRDVRQYADSQGILTSMSISPCNPVTAPMAIEDYKTFIEKQLRACAAGGWYDVRAFVIASDERYVHPIAWPEHVRRSGEFISSMRPVLEKSGCRINIENHGDTTFEVLRIVEMAGPDICGVCFDTANTLVNGEDPVLAARRVAPYTHMTHIKDAILGFTDTGVVRQGKAPGQGIVDFNAVLRILGEYQPDLMLSVEDHKWLFQIPVYEQSWWEKNPDLSPHEISRFLRLAAETQQRLLTGTLPGIDEYEAIPYLEQMEDRLAFGLAHLRSVLANIGQGRER